MKFHSGSSFKKSADHPSHPVHEIANILNISEGGLRFACHKRIEPETILDITINIGEINKQVTVEGKVIWSRRKKNLAHCYHHGVSFVRIHDADRKLIQVLVD
ncbi:MAG: PilZ domain-containing protein, partial [Candidatus Omnitrophica bacterium]|nr:PilZ domain-containing protein [Candidatus Omnitrophota bacterium]